MEKYIKLLSNKFESNEMVIRRMVDFDEERRAGWI